jgi:hypothetical protein
VQVRVKVAPAVRSPVLCEPLVGSFPLHPPDAEQEVALEDDQANVEAAPLLTVLGLAARLTVGAGVVTVTVADCEALPPAPVQVIV